jgi:hypothetical protein
MNGVNKMNRDSKNERRNPLIFNTSGVRFKVGVKTSQTIKPPKPSNFQTIKPPKPSNFQTIKPPKPSNFQTFQ